MDENEKWIDAGYLQAMFDNAIESISKLAVTGFMDESAHNAVYPMLNDMLLTLHSMKNNVLSGMLLGDPTPIKEGSE